MIIRERLRRLLAQKVLAKNFSPSEIMEYTIVDGLPTLVLADGTRLSSFWSMDRGDFLYAQAGIPPGFEKVIADYLLRYKYPHFLPCNLLKTGCMPRAALPIHPQHRNTVFDLSYSEAKFFASRLLVNPSSVVLEAGCFIGFGTIALSRLVGSDGHVYSMEVVKENWEVANRNLNANTLRNVSIERVGLGPSDGTANLFRQSKQANSIIPEVIDHESEHEVVIRRLDSTVSALGSNPNFIVLTINGAELPALEAAKDLLSSMQDVRLITPGWYQTQGTANGPRLVSLLKHCGFRVAMTRQMHVFAFKE